MDKYVIVVAGGSGKRMQQELPKQFIPIAGKPVLMHTIQAFKTAFDDIKIITVIPEKHIKLWKELCVEFSFSISHTIATGGETRFNSVQNGLKHVTTDSIVGVHDGVRPFVSKETIQRVFIAAQKYGTAIPVVELNDSIRKISNGLTEPANRNHYRLVQTPQCFRSDIIKNSYNTNYRPEFTDDASVVEAYGIQIKTTQGNFENIKITRSIDLAIAEVLTHKRYII